MAFKDLVRQQRQKGSGILSSVGSAAAGSVRESLDIRNALFSSGSFLNTLFPKVKGFKAGNNVGKGKTPSLLSSSGLDLSSSKLDQIGENTKIAAKNSFVLPAMARDMNVMRQNIIKLVKMSGGKPSTKSDMFFLKAAERESAYESAMANSKGSMTTKVGSGAQSKTGETGSSMVSILSSILLGGFKTIKGMLSGLLNTFDIFKGIMSSIASSAIFKLFTGGIVTLLKSVFAAIGSPLVLGIIAGFLPLLYTMFKAKQILDAPAVKDELRETQLQSNKNTINESKNIKIGDQAAADLIEQEQNLYTLASRNPRMMTEKAKKESAARRKALASAGIFPLEIDDPATKKKQLVFRREVKEENLLDLPPEQNTSPQKVNKSDGLELLNRVMDSEGVSDPETRNRIIKLAQVESTMDPNAMGPVITDPKSMHKGDRAHGLLQVMPKTAPEVGFTPQDLRDPEKAAVAGVRYFMKNLGRFNNNLDAATVAHHSGPGGAKRWMETGSAGTTDVATNLKTDEYLSRVRGQSSTMVASTRQSGSSLNAGSVQVADARMNLGSSQPVIINAPQTNVQQGSSNSGNSGNIPSVVDTDFMRHLVAQMSI
jgi:soluble lytic murein transglycosylase-like protein